MRHATDSRSAETTSAKAFLPATPGGNSRLILRGAALIDGTGGEVVPDSEIEVDGERIVYAGPSRRTRSRDPSASVDSSVADSEFGASSAVMRGGADVIKVCTTGGVSSPTDIPDDIGLPEEHVRLIVTETAKRSHQPVAAHAQGAEGIKAAIRGGAASVEHGYGIDVEGIDLMLEYGTFLVPTLSSALRVPDPRDVPAYLYEKKVTWSAIARERVAAALAAGVRTALGTDVCVCPHGQNLWEAVHAVELGLSPMDAIVAGTRNAAELLRLDSDVGTLEAGRLADLIIVDFDPLADITPLAAPDNVKAILQGGALVKDRGALFPDPPIRALLSP